jgi:type IV pilus assembly protein PilV
MINNRGFTLIEFLVAVVILMVGLLGMLQGINLAMEKSMESVFRNEGLAVADDLMIAKRNMSFVSISTNYVPGGQEPNWVTLPSGPRFTRGVYKNYSVQQKVILTTPQTKEVVINVSWNHKKQRKTHSVSSFVSTTVVP